MGIDEPLSDGDFSESRLTQRYGFGKACCFDRAANVGAGAGGLAFIVLESITVISVLLR